MDSMKTYAILSYNRTGSTVVGQCLAQAHNKDYIGEITNIPEVLMRYDDNGKDVNVPYELPLPNGTYVKTYDQIDGRIQRNFIYDDPKPFVVGTQRYVDEVEKRKQLLTQNTINHNKSFFKIQTQTFVRNFQDNSLLDDYSFIFCARRNIKEQMLSYLVSKNTNIMHIGFEDQIVDVPTFNIKRKHFDFCVRGLKDTNLLFEHFKTLGQIEKIIYYEDWQHDVGQILPLLGFESQKVHTYKKIKYTLGHKTNLVNNLQEVYDWMKDDDIFDYKYTI